jgi:hypothetical protein
MQPSVDIDAAAISTRDLELAPTHGLASIPAQLLLLTAAAGGFSMTRPAFHLISSQKSSF